jgi:hypothetical protein
LNIRTQESGYSEDNPDRSERPTTNDEKINEGPLDYQSSADVLYKTVSPKSKKKKKSPRKASPTGIRVKK